MKTLCIIFIFTNLFLAYNEAESANILGLFPHPGKSHFFIFQPLMEELARRGHNVTVVSPFPASNPIKGYHDISLEGLEAPMVNIIPFDMFESTPPSFINALANIYGLYVMATNTCSVVVPSPQIQNLANRKDFDLVIMEQFNTDCLLGLVYKLQIPFIGISSCQLLPWHYSRLAIPSEVSTNANMFYNGPYEMGILQRSYNAFLQFFSNQMYSYFFDRPAQKLAEQYFGQIPPVSEIAKNTSLMLVNTHFSLFKPFIAPPSLVEIGGIHIKPPNPLPKELESFIAEAKDGAILFTFGSMLISETMSQTKLFAFIDAFRQIPQRVIWKINLQNMNVTEDDMPSNVKIMKWLPQRDILAHKNIRGFIAHGGLLGLTEALSSATPLVAVPMFGDQFINVRAAVRAGFAVSLTYGQLSSSSLVNALQEILSEKYQKRAQELSSQFNDRPMKPMDLAVYWTDYVLRHGGGPLKSEAVNLSTMEYYLMDSVFLPISLLIIAIFAIAKCSLTWICPTKLRKNLKKEKSS